MTSHTNHDPSYDNLMSRARRLIRGRATLREQALAEEVANIQAQHEDMPVRTSAGCSVPEPVARALQAAAGQDQRVIVHHNGMVIKAVLHPHGEYNPERQAAVWRCLHDQATALRGEHN